MNLQELYERVGGDYADVLSRLMTEERVLKFVRRFPEDASFNELRAALDSGNTETAFRAAHTLKGIAQNLGFTALYKASDELTEALRPGSEDDIKADIPALFSRTSEEYEKVVAAIAEIQ